MSIQANTQGIRSVRNQRSRRIERYQFRTPDGLVFELHDPPNRAVISSEGWGLLPVQAETTRGPYQHGHTLLGVRGEPRSISVVVRFNGCTRENYWDLRNSINEAFRPNRTNMNNPTLGRLTRIFPDGRVRAVDLIRVGGLDFPPRDGWDEFSVQDTIDFVAYDPSLYDPSLKTASLIDFTPAVLPNTSLKFPMLFPFTLGTSDSMRVTKSTTITYPGTWSSFPTITVTGPGSDLLITNLDTGKFLHYEGEIVAGEIITFDLAYDTKTVSSSTGLPVILTDDSNVAEFSIAESPTAPNGQNRIEARINGGSVATRIDLSYYNRYAGI